MLLRGKEVELILVEFLTDNTGRNSCGNNIGRLMEQKQDTFKAKSETQMECF